MQPPRAAVQDQVPGPVKALHLVNESVRVQMARGSLDVIHHQLRILSSTDTQVQDLLAGQLLKD
ncbi:hypothetical protein [Streptomyces melanogenes]|uniref:hypothetical protein n=1 Tax=Streptomyces melanogenes TaxID=67326 RepID=UPI00167EE022|nr:hypothetical protein [Streptomyces melanogenes]GGP89975.1 hypothetical protein GCM10010278_80490 [Streptomyces melanogenes]